MQRYPAFAQGHLQRQEHNRTWLDIPEIIYSVIVTVQMLPKKYIFTLDNNLAVFTVLQVSITLQYNMNTSKFYGSIQYDVGAFNRIWL